MKGWHYLPENLSRIMINLLNHLLACPSGEGGIRHISGFINTTNIINILLTSHHYYHHHHHHHHHQYHHHHHHHHYDHHQHHQYHAHKSPPHHEEYKTQGRGRGVQ